MKRWTVADFAAHAGISHKAAKRVLEQYDAECGGTLLDRSNPRRLTFSRARLKRIAPDLFVDLRTLETRLDMLQENLAGIERSTTLLSAQNAFNAHELSKER